MRVKFEDLPALRADLKGKKVVFKGGVFDILHVEHIEGLRLAKEQGDILVVGVSTDERVRQRKGADRPINPERNRLKIVDSIKYVDYSFLMPLPNQRFASPTMEVLMALRPDTFAEHYEEFRWSQKDIDRLSSLGINLFVDQRHRQIYSTKIIDKISGE